MKVALEMDGSDTELLFFDTFSHDNTEDLNLDLVQFAHPVLIREVRVVPLGTRVTANFPGGVRLGATTPSAFLLELFVHNLHKPNGATFEKLGILDYKQNVDIQLISDAKIPTDGLIIKGCYTTVTLAVYGSVTTGPREKDQSPPPPAPPPTHSRSKPQAILPNNSEQQHSEPVFKPSAQESVPAGTNVAAPHPNLDHTQAPWSGRDSGSKVSEQIYSISTTESIREPADDGYSAMDAKTDSPMAIPLDSRGGAHDPRGVAHDPRGVAHDSRDYHRSEGGEKDSRRDRDEYGSKDDWEGRDRRKNIWELGSSRSRSRSTERDRRDYKDSRDKDRDRHWDARDDYRDRDYGRDSRDYRDREYWDSSSFRDRDYKEKEKDRESYREPEKEEKRGHERSWTPDRRRSRSPGHQRSNWTPERQCESTRSRSHSVEREERQEGDREERGRKRSREREERVREERPRERELVQVPLQDDETEPGEIPEEMAPDQVDIYEGIPDEIPSDDRMSKIYDALSDGEIQDPEGDAYSEISSDENMMADIQDRMGDWTDLEMDDAWIGLTNFNPDQCDLAPMDTFSDPGMTSYELAKQKLLLTKEEELVMPPEATEILSIVDQFKTEPHRDKWVEAMDRLPALVVPGLVYIINKTDRKDVLDCLVEWTFEGLNLSAAKAQPLTAYKLRHLKMGIRLAGTLCSCDSYLAFAMLSKEVQHRLLDLYTSEHMSSSVQLQVVRALDLSTRLHDGMDWLLGKHHLQIQTGTGIREDRGESKGMTGYQRVVSILMDKQVVRSAKALTVFLRKVHCYQILGKMAHAVETIQEKYDKWMAENTPVAESQRSLLSGSNNESDEEREAAMETSEVEPAMMLDSISNEEVEQVIECLEEATTVLVHAESLIAQPRRSLPNTVVFSVRQKPHDPYPNLYHMFSSCRLLESIFMLLSSPASCNHIGIFAAIRRLLTQLIHNQSGLIYLSAKTDTVNGILRTLTQNTEFNGEEGHGMPLTHQLGLKMIYYLQTLQIIDQLKEYLSRGDKNLYADEAIVLGLLHNLYTMTFTPQGRDAVVHVMSMEDNMTVLLPFVELTGDEEKDQQLHRSIIHNYALLLVLLVTRNSSWVPWLEKYGARILASCDTEASPNKLADKVSELRDWLQPLAKVPAFIHDASAVGPLVTQLKALSEEVATLPPALVTVLRILRHLAIDPFPDKLDFLVEELKYKHVLIELFSSDCVPVFTNIIQKVGDLCLRPWQQGIPNSGVQATVVMGLLKPTLEMLRNILSYLIQARGTEFKDLTALPCLFNLHTVMCSVSNTGTLSPPLQEVQDMIVDILMTFTQPALEAKEFEEGLTQSLWTLMVKEVFKYSLTAPYTFLSGLVLISEMLPLPLPVQTRENLCEEEVESAINCRKLWGAHIHPITADMQEIIKAMSDTSCQPLQQLLRRVCWQLADLAAPTALSVVRCLLDVLLESMDSTIERHRKDMELERERRGMPPQDEAAKEEARASGQTSRILNLLAFLMNQAPIKAAFLHLIQSGAKADEKYSEFLRRLVGVLNAISDKDSHTQAQMSIVSIFQSLCDLMVTMVMGDNMTFAEQLANSVPMRDQLELLCVGLLEHINNREHKFSSVLPSLRTLALLMDHDYGFYHVKQALDRVPSAFYQLFSQINATFSKDSSDCIATLSSAAECIQFLVTLPEPDPSEAQEEGPSSANSERTFTISWAEVREILCWTPDQLGHPLDDLDKLLKEYAKEEETLKAVHESINGVCCIVKEDHPGPKSDLEEPELPAPETLSQQFALRAIYVMTDEEDERLSSIYWLSTPMAEESDQEIEKVECDLDDMNRKFCPDYNLLAELEKGAIPSDALTTLKPRRRARSNRTAKDTINTSKMRGNNRGFIAPMRGRGFGRGMPTGRNDLFRSRPPNTSRPPSMHVDDFIKMESEGQAPTMPTGMNPPMNNRRNNDKDQAGTGRGRGGFDRGGIVGSQGGFSNRGQFFSPPANYGRRDNAGSSAYGSQHSNSLLGSASGFGGQYASSHNPRTDQWSSQTPQQRSYSSRMDSDGRLSSASRMDRHQAAGGRFGQHGGSRGGRGSSSSSGRAGDWQGSRGNKDSDGRFGQQSRQSFRGGGRGFRENRGRHQRSFTK